MQSKTATQRNRGATGPLSGRGSAPVSQPLPGSSTSQPASTYIPRRMRSKLRADAAMARGKGLGAPMLQTIEDMIAVTNGPWWAINSFKIGVENLLHSGEDRARMRFGEIARSLPTGLDAALVEIERILCSEVAHVRQLSEYAIGGRHHGMCLNRIDKLRNARLILRLMRFTGHRDAYPAIREAVAAEIPLVEAFRSFHRSVNPAGYR